MAHSLQRIALRSGNVGLLKHYRLTLIPAPKTPKVPTITRIAISEKRIADPKAIPQTIKMEVLP